MAYGNLTTNVDRQRNLTKQTQNKTEDINKRF